MNRTVMTHVHVQGSLTGTDKKWETLIMKVGDGELRFYQARANAADDSAKKKKEGKESKKKHDDGEGLVEVLPLTGASVSVVPKTKEKTPTPYGFSITGAGNNKKWRTFFFVETESILEQWLEGIGKSIDLATSTVFGTTIEDACYKANKHVPVVVEICVACIDTKVKTEGLFRVPGDKSKIEIVADAFNRGEIPDLGREEIHLTCSLLKAYLSELRDPLIPFSSYKQFISAANNSKEDERVSDLTAAIASLPVTNRSVLAFIIAFLSRIREESASNLMDTTNLGVVFGPTIVRNNKDKESSAKAAGLEDMASANRCIELMITHKNQVFTPEDFELWKKPVFDSDLKAMKMRDCLTQAERTQVEAIMKTHTRYRDPQPPLDNALSFLVNIRNQKTRELEPRILVLDHYRIYVFLKGGKDELQFHFLDIKDITSPIRTLLTITYQTAADKLPNSIEIFPVNYGSLDIDAIIRYIHIRYETDFVGRLPSEKFAFKLAPPERAVDLLVLPPLDIDAGCGGMVKSYLSICDWKGTPVSEDIVWDLENYFFENNIRVFNVADVINKHNDKWPNTDFDALSFALQHNLWFNEYQSTVALGNDSLVILGESFRFNRNITKLQLKDAKADRIGMNALFTGFSSNNGLAITRLDVSGNEIDAKAGAILCECLEGKPLSKLVALDLSNTQLNKKTLSPLLQSLTKSSTLISSLSELSFNGVKFDEISSTDLGKYLGKTKALSTLRLSGTGINYTKVIDGMIEGTNLNTCSSLKTLDLSDNALKLKQAGELISFCKYLPNLTSLNIAGATSGVSFTDNVIELLNTNTKLTELDISDIDLTDEGFLSFLQFLVKEECKVTLTKLTMNYGFQKKTKARSDAMRAITKALNTMNIKEFSIKGGKGAALKTDLLDMIFGLMNNTTLEILDISGHQGGDDLAVGIAKVLQHNTSIHTLYLDQNSFTISGLIALKLGLMRNKHIKYLPLPLIDMAAILKDNEENAAKLFPITKELQRIVFENAVSRSDESSTPSIPAKNSQAHKKKDKEKRRSTYDEHRAALLFGAHLGDEESQKTSEKGSEADGSVTEEDTSSPAMDRPKLSKSNSQQVLDRLPSSKSPSPLPSPSTMQRSLSVTPTVEKKERKKSRPLVKKLTTDRHARRPSEAAEATSEAQEESHE